MLGKAVNKTGVSFFFLGYLWSVIILVIYFFPLDTNIRNSKSEQY